MEKLEKLYKTQEVAELLGVNVQTIRRYIREGRLKAVKNNEKGRLYYITETSIKAFLGQE